MVTVHGILREFRLFARCSKAVVLDLVWVRNPFVNLMTCDPPHQKHTQNLSYNFLTKSKTKIKTDDHNGRVRFPFFLLMGNYSRHQYGDDDCYSMLTDHVQ